MIYYGERWDEDECDYLVNSSDSLDEKVKKTGRTKSAVASKMSRLKDKIKNDPIFGNLKFGDK